MTHPTPIPLPDGLELWTADEVAECLPYGDYLPTEQYDDLYVRLWALLEDAESPTPLGGDGSNGTVETPGERLSLDNDDKAPHWWGRLTPTQQVAIRDAYIEETA